MTTPSLSTAVLHVALNPVTGPWSVIKQLSQAQKQSGLYSNVGIGVIVDKAWPQTYSSQLASLGLPTFRTTAPKMFGTAQFLHQYLRPPPVEKWAEHLCRESGAEAVTVHFHNAWMSGVFLPVRPIAGRAVKQVVTVHGVNATFRGQPVRHCIHRWMARRLLHFGANLVSVDQSNLPLAARILGLPIERFKVIPNGMPRSRELGCPWAKEHRVFTVGHVGGISEIKGWRIAVEAVRLVAGTGKKVRILIAGHGPESGMAVEIAKQYSDLVEYVGFVPDAQQAIMPKLDLLSVMSVHEGLPMCIIEAMSCGVPVAATPVGGIPEAVRDGETGHLIPRSAEALAGVISDLYEHPDKLSVLSAGARRCFEGQYEIGRVVKLYDAVYGGGR